MPGSIVLTFSAMAMTMPLRTRPTHSSSSSSSKSVSNGDLGDASTHEGATHLR